MSHLLSWLLFLLHTSSFSANIPNILRKQSCKAGVSATCSLFMVQTPGTCRRINTSFQLLPSLYLCCYSLLMISSSACFSVCNIFVLCYFELLVISKVSEHCPVQHLFKYPLLGRFWIASSTVCFSQGSVLFGPLSVRNLWLSKMGRFCLCVCGFCLFFVFNLNILA